MTPADAAERAEAWRPIRRQGSGATRRSTTSPPVAPRYVPEAFAVRDRHRRLTYPELVAAADRLAGHLAGNGLRAGERVAVWLPSRVETAIALLACSRNAYVCCPSLHRDHRVGRNRRAGGAGARRGVDRAARLRRRRRPARCFRRTRRPRFSAFLLAGRPGRCGPFAALPGPAIDRPASDDANQIMYLPFTSGTTGIPKGVLHSDNTLLATARMMARDWRLDGAVLYTLSPLSHNLGLGALITALAGGGEARAARSAARRQPDRPAGRDRRRIPVRGADACDRSAGGDARPRRAAARQSARLPHFRRGGAARAWSTALMEHGIVPQSGYGMTETCSHQYTRPDDPPDAHRRNLRASLRRLRAAHLAPGRPGRRGGSRRDRRDRRPRRQPDARLFRRSDRRPRPRSMRRAGS